MSTVIEFRSPIGRAMPREDGAANGEVIIFPGVRRERHAETEPDGCEASAKPRRHGRAKPKRDRIELPD